MNLKSFSQTYDAKPWILNILCWYQMLTFSIGADSDKTNNTIYTCNYLNYPYCSSLIVFTKLACIIYDISAVNHQSTFQTATHQLNDRVSIWVDSENNFTFGGWKLYHIYLPQGNIFLVIFVKISQGLHQNYHNYNNSREEMPFKKQC